MDLIFSSNKMVGVVDSFFNCVHSFIVNYLFLAEPTKKVKLTMIPMSKNWSFGKEDVDELLFMLQVNSIFK